MEYIAIKNWEKYQADAKGNLREGPSPWIKDWTAKEEDREYSELTCLQRYLYDALRRLRGKLGKNPANDPVWIGRILSIPGRERKYIPAAIKKLLELRLITLSDKRVEAVATPLEPVKTPLGTVGIGKSAGINESTSKEIEIEKEKRKSSLAQPVAALSPDGGTTDQTPTPENWTEDQEDSAVQLCQFFAECSGIKQKPEWFPYARDVIAEFGYETCTPVVDWIFHYQIEDEKFRWADRTKSMKNFRDHMRKGSLLDQLEEARRVRDAKRVKAAKASASQFATETGAVERKPEVKKDCPKCHAKNSVGAFGCCEQKGCHYLEEE